MQPELNTINKILMSFYRISGVLAALSMYLFLACILLIPGISNAKGKILSLDLCSDWMLAKYASRSQVLALSPLIHQYHPDWIDKDWPVHDGSIEQILQLKPDLVITGEYNALILRTRLQELGIKVEALTLPKNLSQVNRYEEHFLALLGQPARNADQSWPQFVNTNDKHRPRLLLLGANGIGTGRETFEGDILQFSGWENYLQQNGYISLDLEKLVSDPPDAVLWVVPTSEALSNLFADHPALQKAIPKDHWLSTAPWKWQCPGPWTRDLVNELNALLPKAGKQ